MSCRVCSKGEAQYKCPACGARTCSVACVKLHKQNDGCSGVKPKAKFIQVDEMSEYTLAKDIKLYDEAHHTHLKAKEELDPRGKSPKWRKSLKKACSDQGINIFYLPAASSRSKENKTRFISSDNVIRWTIKWRFYSGPKNMEYEYLQHSVHQDVPVFTVLRALIDTVQNDYVAKIDLSKFTPLLVAEGAEGGGYYKIEQEESLSTLFFAKTIIEYPVINVVPNETLESWKVVSIFEVKRLEKSKAETTEQKETPLPDYEEIKKALKQDIVRTAFQEQ